MKDWERIEDNFPNMGGVSKPIAKYGVVLPVMLQSNILDNSDIYSFQNDVSDLYIWDSCPDKNKLCNLVGHVKDYLQFLMLIGQYY